MHRGFLGSKDEKENPALIEGGMMKKELMEVTKVYECAGTI